MGKTENSGLGIGASGFPQGNLIQSNLETKIKRLAKKKMLAELEKAGVKFNPKEVLFVAKDKKGQLLWLEKGNEKAGFEHIKKHTDDFVRKHGIKSENLEHHIKDVLTHGKIIFCQKKLLGNGNVGIEKIYCYKGKYFALCAIGSNGFIVTIYPLDGGNLK